jgi:outer membrane protein assembly factor BamB
MIMRKGGIILFLVLCTMAVPIQNQVKDSGLGQDSWPLFRGSSELKGSIALSLPAKLRFRWRFETGDEIKSSPVIAENALFIGSDDGKLYKLRVQDGTLLWAFTAGASIEASPLVLDKVYFGDLTGIFYALELKSGRVQWKYQTGSQIIGSANYYFPPYGNFPWLVVGSYDNKIHCINAISGMGIWTYRTKSYVNGTPAVRANRIVTGGCDAFLYSIAAQSGAELGKTDTGSYIAGSPALYGNYAYVGNYGGRLVCVDLNSQEIVWEFNEPSSQPFFSSPAVTEERLVIGSRSGTLYCFRRLDGKLLWTYATGGEINSSPLICGGEVIAGSDDGYLYRLSLKDGSKIWSYFIGEGISGSPAVAFEMLFVGARDGAVYAFAGQ